MTRTKMTKSELIEAIDKAKENHKYYPEAIYEEVYQAVDEYMRSNNDWSLECVFEEYAEEDWINQEIEYRLKTMGYGSVWNLLSSIQSIEPVYKLNVYGYLENLTDLDVECLIADIKERLKDKEDKEQKNEKDY